MSIRTQIAIALSLMVNALLFGFGAIAVLAIPFLNDHAALALPIVIVGSLLVTPFISWSLAPRLRLRHWR